MMPLVFEELANTALMQRELLRQPEDRMRIAARDGKPVIWKDSVIADHRPRRGENADGTRKHLDIAQLGTDGSSTNSAATAS
ncbi:MAG: hypothetical protein JNG88_12700 [Phycisphaerales bacterium]|nr:hypothetical protein [Phycisphaerales bacterium]